MFDETTDNTRTITHSVCVQHEYKDENGITLGFRLVDDNGKVTDDLLNGNIDKSRALLTSV